MAKTINLLQTFLETIDAYEDGEYLNESVLNRPLVQIGNNTAWLYYKVAELEAELDTVRTGGVDYSVLDARYEAKITKKSAFNLDAATQAEVDAGTNNKVALSNHNHDARYDSRYEPKFSKNTAFNKNFGNTSGTVAQGNDPRLSDSRNPLYHQHDLVDLKANGAVLNDILLYDGTKWKPVASSSLGGGTSSLPWNNITSKPTTVDGYGITDVYTISQVDAKVASAGGSTNTGIFVTSFITANGQTTFTLPDSNAVFRVTQDGLDLEASSYSRVNLNLTIPSAQTGSVINVYQQGTQAGLIRQEFTANTTGSNTFVLSSNGPVFSITVNGLDVASSEWTQSNTNITITGINSGDTIITLRTRGF